MEINDKVKIFYTSQKLKPETTWRKKNCCHNRNSFQFNDERSTLRTCTGEIKNGFTVMSCRTAMRLQMILQIAYHFPALKQGIQKCDQQALIRVRSKYPFETKIS